MTVQLEPTLFEARSLLKRLGPDGSSMTADECLAVEVFRKKLDQGIKVETGPGGSEEDVEAIAERLVGQRVRVRTVNASTFVGLLHKLDYHSSIVVTDGGLRHRVDVASIDSIAAERQAA